MLEGMAGGVGAGDVGVGRDHSLRQDHAVKAELFHSSQATDVLSKEPHTCPVCKRVAYWFRNQGGRSRCIGCVIDGEPVAS